MKKMKNIYIFLSIICLISFIAGFKYYDFQNDTEKNEIKENIDIKKTLNTRENNILKTSKNIAIIFICSILIIPILINITKLFYESFAIAFVMSILKTYSFKIAFLFGFVYYIIPLIFLIWLVRIGISISKQIIKYFLKHEKNTKKRLILLIKKYILISIFLIIYQILIFIFSPFLNNYLLGLL